MSAATVRVGVGCFVTMRKEGETYFLIGQRKGSHGGGAWGLPGGHLEMGESWSAGAQREVLEECGVEVLSELFHVATLNNIFNDSVPMKHYITLYMAPKAPGFKGSVRLMEPDKCSRWVWVTWKELVSGKAALYRDACNDGASKSLEPLMLEPLFLPLKTLVKQFGSKRPFDAAHADITELPFKSKPKIIKTDAPTKRAAVVDKKDKQVATLFNEINLLGKDKAKRQKQKAQKQQVEYMKKRRDAEEEADACCKKN
ncbi:hypothetical protein EV179_006443, partial [Coemansia sp. RSA 487]